MINANITKKLTHCYSLILQHQSEIKYLIIFSFIHDYWSSKTEHIYKNIIWFDWHFAEIVHHRRKIHFSVYEAKSRERSQYHKRSWIVYEAMSPERSFCTWVSLFLISLNLYYLSKNPIGIWVSIPKTFHVH